MNVDNHIERFGGEWNEPSIESETLGLWVCAYAPKLRGGCMGIIPHNAQFVIFGEDDDRYWEECVMSLEELTQYLFILTNLALEINVVIDYVAAKSSQTYNTSKEEFLSKNRNRGDFEVSITDRGDHTSPLVRIINSKLQFDDQFDVFWAARKAGVCRQALIQNKP